MSLEQNSSNEKLFEGLKVYYSGSIKGSPEIDPNFAWHLVQFMIQGGADVLSEHVAARNMIEMEQIRARRMNVSEEYLRSFSKEDYLREVVRKTDIKWVDEATHVIALVNAPSHGVGMELERAILKPERGLGLTPILCLVHEDVLPNLSGMIRGVSENENPKYYVKTYKNLKEAENLVSEFLTGKLS